jgi:spore coat polysaccharide biosynthesis predicted glycosyltransferase SpsG
MGHVIRCLALANELHNGHNCRVEFAMRGYSLGTNKVKESYPVHEMNVTFENIDYLNWLVECIRKTDTQMLILDVRDGLTQKDLRMIRASSDIKIVTIDDPENKRMETDLAFYPPVPQLKTFSWEGYKGELYVGWEYVILRKEFSQKYKDYKNSKPNILINMGGTDANNLTEFVVDTIDLINDMFDATIILGPGYKFEMSLHQRLKTVGYNYRIFRNPSNVAKIMSQTDLAIVLFGQTAYELTALGIRALHICLSPDHIDSARLFENEGYSKILGIYTDKTSISKKLMRINTQFSKHSPRNNKMGRGTHNIARTILHSCREIEVK